MNIKYCKTQFCDINKTPENFDCKSKKLTMPTIETFNYILEKAKTGNEMAAVQIDEWQKFCKPKNNQEKSVFRLINCAAKELFE